MADDIDVEDQVHTMNQPQFSIREMLARQVDAVAGKNSHGDSSPALAEASPMDSSAETLPTLDDISPLPRPGDSYNAFGRPSNKPQPTLILLLADASCRGFSYANLDTVNLMASVDPGQGLSIVATFSGHVPTEVRLSGRYLDRLYSYLCAHRIGWIRQRAPSRDFLPDDETVVTAITIGRVEE